MPDIRIKDLTTTASTTAADDFFAADGTTNGTRKLSAYSPTFGGNATVGGTLTVNSATTLSNVVVSGTFRLANNNAQYWLDSGATERRLVLVSGGNASYFGPVDAGWGGNGYFSAGSTIVLRTNGASGTFNEAVSISTGGVVTIASTSASTTTSSGALVVGNGTSGGLGVGGAVNAGANIRTAGALVAAGNTNPTSGYGTEIMNNGTNGYVFAYNRDTSAAQPLYLNHAGGNVIVASTAGVTTIAGTTASSAYNNGALVVSGGVGIAGALYSQQNTNAILSGTYFENTSTGNAAAIRHRLIVGASTCDIDAYGSGHATLANRLRFGTSNGQIDFVPSGVLGMSVAANGVTIPNSLTVSGTTTADGLATSGFFGGS